MTLAKPEIFYLKRHNQAEVIKKIGDFILAS